MYNTPNTIQNKKVLWKKETKKNPELTSADAKAELHTNIAYVASGHLAVEQTAWIPTHTADDLPDRVPWTQRIDEEWDGIIYSLKNPAQV